MTDTEAPALVLRAPDAPDAVLANVDLVAPLILRDADECDRIGSLTADLSSAFRRAGFYEMGFPTRVGGVEMTLADQVTVVARIARLDAGCAWNVAVLNATGYYATRLSDAAYAELYPARDLPTSGSFHPRGRADTVDGGYLVSGRWDWGSGSSVAEHVIGGCHVFDNGEPVAGETGAQLILGLWLPREEIRFLDNWQVLGQRASGSGSYVIEEPVFVPAQHGFERERGPKPELDPLNRHVMTVFFPLTGICVGLAHRALDLAAEAIRRRARAGGAGSVYHRLLGESLAEVDATFSFITDIARRTDDILFTQGRTMTPVEEGRLNSLNLMAAESLRRVMTAALEIYGSFYVFDSDPMQRVVRDVEVALAHAGSRRMHWEFAGAAAAGVESIETLMPATRPQD